MLWHCEDTEADAVRMNDVDKATLQLKDDCLRNKRRDGFITRLKRTRTTGRNPYLNEMDALRFECMRQV